MNLNMTLGQKAEFGMPAMRGWSASVCTFRVNGTRVSAYAHGTDLAIVKGAFPGTSAWSPPI